MTAIGVLLCIVGFGVFAFGIGALAMGLCASASIADARMDEAVDRLHEEQRQGG